MSSTGSLRSSCVRIQVKLHAETTPGFPMFSSSSFNRQEVGDEEQDDEEERVKALVGKQC